MEKVEFTNYDGSFRVTCYLEGAGGWFKAADNDGKVYYLEEQVPDGEDTYRQFYVAEDGACISISGDGDPEIFDSLDEAKEFMREEA